MKKFIKCLICALIIIACSAIIIANRFNTSNLTRNDVLIISGLILIIILMLIAIMHFLLSPEKKEVIQEDYTSILLDRRNDEIVNRLSTSNDDPIKVVAKEEKIVEPKLKNDDMLLELDKLIAETNKIVAEPEEDFVQLLYELETKIENSKKVEDKKKLGDTSIKPKKNTKATFGEKKLVSKVFNKFCRVQTALVNEDYEFLKQELTKDLYNKYCVYMDLIKLKNQKLFMSDYSLIDSKLLGVENDEDKNIVRLELSINCLSYIENIKTNEVVSGNKDKTTKLVYELEYIKQGDNQRWLLSSKTNKQD